MVVDTYAKFTQAMEWLNGQDMVSFDIETDGLRVRQDRIIGFGVSNGVDGLYVPVYSWDGSKLVPVSYAAEVKAMLAALQGKKLICHNAAFDIPFTQNAYGVTLIASLYADTMLMAHLCDENLPSYGLKELGENLYGKEETQAKDQLQASIKANGGTIKEYYKADTAVLADYCIQDCMLTFKLYNHYSKQLKDQGLSDFFYRDEVMPLLREVVVPMESAGIQLDVPLLRQTQVELTYELTKLEQGIQAAIIPHLDLFTTSFLNKDYPLVTWTTKKPSSWTKKYKTQEEAFRAENTGYMFNLQSKHHLKKLFFDTLKEKPCAKTPKGAPKVDEEFIELMAHKYPWAAQLLEYNKLTKIKTAYIDRFLEEVSDDGRYYPKFFLHRTVSGRMAGDFQQLPRTLVEEEASSNIVKFNNRIRQSIIPAAGHKLIVADYAQLEPRTFCHTSQDKALRSIFTRGDDFYTVIARRVEGLKEVTKQARQRAKEYALGICYGLTGYKLQFTLACSLEQGGQLVKAYLDAFPELAAWMEKSKQVAKTEGYAKTESGRIRHLGQAVDLKKTYGSCIDDDLELWKTYNKYPDLYERAKKDRRTYKNLLNNSMNFKVQGMAASIINRASIAVNRELKRMGLKARLVNQIHDELVFECPEQELHTVSHIVQTCMEQTTQLTVPLLALPQIGNRYSECK